MQGLLNTVKDGRLKIRLWRYSWIQTPPFASDFRVISNVKKRKAFVKVINNCVFHPFRLWLHM